jgi:hypothetical protein
VKTRKRKKEKREKEALELRDRDKTNATSRHGSQTPERQGPKQIGEAQVQPN